MSTGEVAARHLESVATNVTLIPGDGAAAPTALLSNLIVTEVPKLAFRVAEASTMLSEAVVVAAVTPSLYAGLETVTVAVPGRTPASVAFAAWLPAAIVTDGVEIPTMPGALLATLKVTPPAGAGAGSWIGSDAVCP